MSESIHVRGAVDLGALAAQRDAQQRAANAPAAAPGVVVEVTEATFQVEVIDRSMTVPVVIDVWSARAAPSATLSPVLVSLAAEFGGRFVLATINFDAEQRVAAAFQVQAVPAVFAVIKGQPLPLFQGAMPVEELRKVIEEVLTAAENAGVSGTVATQDAPDEPIPEAPLDADLEAAYNAMESAEWTTAEQAFTRFLTRYPTDASAKGGLATASLYARLDGADPVTVLAAAASAPTDVSKQSLAADIEMSNGDAQAAFQRLIETVRITADDDRAAARQHLLLLFEMLAPGDEQLGKARTALANALF